MVASVASGLLDRTGEREVLDRLLAHAREGQSAVLVMRGEAGIGKTALLRYAARQASGFRVAQVTGVEAEMELPFAGIHQLCAPLLDQLDALPQAQQDALNVALGLASGDVPDRFLVGLAVLGLLSAAAEERPLLCLVEDAHWLDAASALILGFVARRLQADPVAILAAVREPNARHDFDGLPELRLGGLGEEDARTLLMSAVPGRLNNGRGRYGEALAAAQRGCEHEDVGVFERTLVELIEAGVRSGATDAASAALDRLSGHTRASGTDWALGVEAGSRALLTDARDAEPHYREAVERLERSRGVVHLARARLLYGEWLRRENRRVDARAQLRAAHEMFSDVGAEGFAERASHELLTTGETARKRTEEARAVLTPQEAHIARLAKDGLSNPEIGAQLFISPRTVQYHLRKVFQKLDITSRNQLSRLPASDLTA